MRNKVKFGLKNAHFVPMNTDGTYDENVYSLPGAVSISLEAEGDSSSFAADDDPDFFTMYVNNGYTGSLEFTLLNEDYLTKVLGQTKDNKGVITENTNDVSFAIGSAWSTESKKLRYCMHIADEAMYADKEEYYKRNPDKIR